MVQQAAQNQHYVPKFILRNFLIDERKETVAAFSKRTGQVFRPSIKGIMAERRFHEFTIDDRFRASFEGDGWRLRPREQGREDRPCPPLCAEFVRVEPVEVAFRAPLAVTDGEAEDAAGIGRGEPRLVVNLNHAQVAAREEAIGRLENLVLPLYRRVVSEERLTGDPEEKALLGFLMAFQLIRTRSQRDQFVRLEELLSSKLERMGASISDLEGWEPIIAAKDLVLMKAPAGSAFYLSDNPVALHNEEPAHPLWGNIGLNVEGIQVYMPLSPTLTPAAWCPSLLAKMRAEADDLRRRAAVPLLAELKAGRIAPEQMRRVMGATEKALEPVAATLAAADGGTPLAISAANVDYCNSLQVWSAREFILCQQQDFALAKRLMAEKPGHKGREWRDATDFPADEA